MKFESINDQKFSKLSREEQARLNGGADGKMGSMPTRTTYEITFSRETGEAVDSSLD